MSSVVLSGDTSGSITLSAPAVAGSSTQTLAAVTGTLAPIVSGTAVSASGTSVDFTGIPSWVKRITVMFSDLSTNGSSLNQVQIGSGSVTTSGYTSTGSYTGSANAYITTGFVLDAAGTAGAAFLRSGILQITLINSNTWVASGTMSAGATGQVTVACGGRSPNLSGSLDRIRITTVNGTDTFDAGSINILYE